jgi:RimJ/RimL family protein N-acetyltransferase
MFLVEEPVRPLTARVAKHNPASVRVLEKCGFEVTAQEEGAPYQGAPVEEFVMTLYGERP